MSWVDGRLLGLDFETTAADPLVAVPCSYALVLRRDGHRMSVDSAIIDPECEIPEEATAIHGISTERARAEGTNLHEAMQRVKDKLFWAQREEIPVVTMNGSYDLTVVHRQVDLSEFTGSVLDVFVLDKQVDRYRKGSRKLSAMCEHYGVHPGDAHSADSDAISVILVVLAMAAKYPMLRMDPAKLHERQVEWHEEQQQSLSEHFVKQGKEPIAPGEFGWPIKRGALGALAEEGC